MIDPVQELLQLKGIGVVTAQRLVAAGLDTFTAIVGVGEEGLRAIPGINPRSIPTILEQAATLSGPSEPTTPDPADELKLMVADLRTAIQVIAAAARERFPEELAGKIGHKLTKNMVAGLDALYAIEELLERRPKRSRKALSKAQKRLVGLPEGELSDIRKGLKRTRKTLERVID
jgi:hypothetical protein